MEPIKNRNGKLEPIRTKTNASHPLANTEDIHRPFLVLHVFPRFSPLFIFPRLVAVLSVPVLPLKRSYYLSIEQKQS